MSAPRGPAKTPKISLRVARPDDFDFAVELYLESTKPLLIALGLWDEERVRTRFAEDFKPHNAQVIQNAGRNIGWIQVSENAEGLHLDQLHIVDGYRNRGIGTKLMEGLLNRARHAGRSVGLNVIRGNRALYFYQRLGFHVVGEDEDKLRMRWKTTRRPVKKRARSSRSPDKI